MTGLHLRRHLDGAVVAIACSTRADGDLHLEVPADDLSARQRTFVALAWSQPDEVHGTIVRRVTAPGACTACRGDLWFSHRARSERERQVMAVWRHAA